MITLAILVTMVYAIAMLIRNGFDVKEALSQKAKITHRFDIAMELLSRDFSGAFIISTKDTARDGSKKRTIFRIKRGDSDTLSFTYVGHRALRENEKESDISYVMYEVRDAKNEPGRKHLYRGDTPRVPKDFNEEPKMFLIAEDIAAIHIEPWRGDAFSSDGWDSSNGETRDLLPHMVRITVLAWEETPEERLGKDVKPSVQYSTVVQLPYALDFKELKTGVSSFSLFK
jgi:hypothetical protein